MPTMAKTRKSHQRPALNAVCCRKGSGPPKFCSLRHTLWTGMARGGARKCQGRIKSDVGGKLEGVSHHSNHERLPADKGKNGTGKGKQTQGCPLSSDPCSRLCACANATAESCV